MDSTVRVRVERISQAGRGIEPGDGIARLSADAREIAARQNLAVRLHCDCIYFTDRVRVKSGVERAVRIQPGDAVARHAQNGGKESADKNFAVRLNGGGVDIVVDGAEIERLVEHAIGFHTDDAVACLSADAREKAAR